VQHEGIGISAQFCDDEGRSVCHQTGDEMHIAGKPVQLGDNDRCSVLLGQVQSRSQGYSLIPTQSFEQEQKSLNTDHSAAAAFARQAT
jgi:hypothetical protein